ncbi:uncharacterized protein DUF3829 [Chitinophaga niastensis]|uniref:Uncharacterized protein DUF3829 n=1 Tax=Chitinophaga niastensis TaxID=536980 RepID=A0A2P8HNP7_CHINA|nr:DUF3829 domain-containing protein [Chitinophaga niastensis]PSL47846.1 uncharacterized protein DUF3829 [Chitinophaga niastensis]
MKKSIFCAAVSIALITTSISCNNSSKEGAAAYAEKSASSASQVIEYTNLLVDMSNKSNNYTSRILGNLDIIEKGLKNPTDAFAFSGVIPPMDIPSFNPSKVTVDKPVDALSKADQQFFKEKVAGWQATYKNVGASYKLLQDYLIAQDFKDDKGAKGYALVDSVRNNIQSLYAQKTVLIKKVNEVADASEAVILKDSPLKDYILAMKADMKSVCEFINILEDGGNDYNKISDKAQAAYDAMEKAQAEHAKIDKTNAAKEHNDASFDSFYTSYHDFLLNAKKIMRDAKEKGALTDSNIESLNGNYDTLISRYNAFNR